MLQRWVRTGFGFSLAGASLFTLRSFLTKALGFLVRHVRYETNLGAFELSKGESGFSYTLSCTVESVLNWLSVRLIRTRNVMVPSECLSF